MEDLPNEIGFRVKRNVFCGFLLRLMRIGFKWRNGFEYLGCDLCLMTTFRACRLLLVGVRSMARSFLRPQMKGQWGESSAISDLRNRDAIREKGLSNYVTYMLDAHGGFEMDWDGDSLDTCTFATAGDELCGLIDECLEGAKGRRRKRK